MPRDWMGRISQKWPILCQVGLGRKPCLNQRESERWKCNWNALWTRRQKETIAAKEREIASLRRQLDANSDELTEAGRSREVALRENRRLQDDMALMTRENQVSRCIVTVFVLLSYLCLRYLAVSAKVLCIWAVRRIRSSVYPDRYCYQNISWVPWTIIFP